MSLKTGISYIVKLITLEFSLNLASINYVCVIFNAQAIASGLKQISHAIAPSCTFPRADLYMEAIPAILMEVGNKED
ncbi:hypothetical protein H6G27_28840 [Nostoc linckia FACHB-104]|nr:hypothetical protein [Nostoc linckia FACHB-104]